MLYGLFLVACVFVRLCDVVILNVFVCFGCEFLCDAVYLFLCVLVLCLCLFVCVLVVSCVYVLL